jgi:hypothetical protein
MTDTDPSSPALPRARKNATNLFIVIFLGFMIVDAVPAISPMHAMAKQILDPILDATGLWQGSWQLFAPSPKSINVWITATIEFEDGSSYEWRSPRWRQLSLGEKFWLCRHTRFYENLRLDSYSEVWPAFAAYRIRQLPEPLRGKKVRRVELVRHWMTIPKPTSLWHSLPTDFRPDRRYLFYSKEYR